MRRISTGWGLLLSFCLCGVQPARSSHQVAPVADTTPVQPVAAVNLERYVGVWHEVAKIPNRFQNQCARGTTATYSLRSDGTIEVLNECFKKNGKRDAARGVARVVDQTSKARLEVSFVSILGWRPFWGDYWILGLDPEYQWAVIGTPDRKYGWILAREATLPEVDLAAAFAILTANGYRAEDFELSPP